MKLAEPSPSNTVPTFSHVQTAILLSNLSLLLPKLEPYVINISLILQPRSPSGFLERWLP